MSTIAVNQITNTSGLSAPVFPAGSAQLNPMAGREDKIINGDFNIWQRGTNSGVVNGYGAADRWMNNYLSGTVGHVRLDHPNGRLFGANVPATYLRQNVAGQTGINGYAVTTQRIEGVRSYASQTITILGWARRTTGAGNMVVEMEQFFGTGTNSPSNRVVGISPTTVTLNAPWAPFAVVVNVPAIPETNVLGNEQNDYLALNFWGSAGSDYDARTNSLGIQTLTMDLWGIHIRHGTWTAAATADYRPRDPGTELALCQRYYWKGLSGVSFNFSSYAANSYGSWYIAFPVTMRGVPLTTGVFPTAVGVDAITFSAGVSGGRLIARATTVNVNANFTMGAANHVSADAEL